MALSLRQSFVLLPASQGAFLHRDWLTTYTEAVPTPVLQYIDDHCNCEDIAMAFLVANATGSPPVYVRAAGLRDLGQGVRKVRLYQWHLDLGLMLLTGGDHIPTYFICHRNTRCWMACE